MQIGWLAWPLPAQTQSQRVIPGQPLMMTTLNTDSNAYVTMESLVALEAFAPGLIESQCASDKRVSMYKDEKRKEVWLLSKGSNHIMPKGTIMGGYGGGAMSARKADRLEVVPWRLPDGDKT